MVNCEILDFKCLFVNEIFGNITLAIIGIIIAYLMTAGKMKFGFETTLVLVIPLGLIATLWLGGFSVVYAFATVIVSFLVAFAFQKIIGNR